MDKSLAKLENASRMLAEVRDAGDAHRLMAKASAAEHYARKAKLGEDAITYAHAIKIDAEILLGQFLKTAERQRRGGDQSTPRELRSSTPPTSSYKLFFNSSHVFGVHSRASRWASAIWAEVIFSAISFLALAYLSFVSPCDADAARFTHTCACR